MKTKQIKGVVDILLVIGLPEHPHRPKNMVLTAYLGAEYIDWQFHCRLSEMTEAQATDLAEISDNPFWLAQGPFIYIDYLNDSNCLETATEAVQSLLEANRVLMKNNFEKPNKGYSKYWINPYEFEFFKAELFADDLKKWQEAEANVFPPETTLVFIKTKYNKQ